MISRETLELCLSLLGQVTLSALDPDLELKAAALVRARDELTKALTDQVEDPE